MTKRGPQLPRIQPVDRAAVNPPHQRRSTEALDGPKLGTTGWLIGNARRR